MRPTFPHSHSHPAHQGSAFSVAGMSNSTVTHSPGLRNSSLGGGSLGMGSPLGDSLSQSRSQYQPGYLMSVTQDNLSPQGGQRQEEAPMVQTKAKLNHVLAGGASDFGMDSMFESSRSRQRQRQTLDDEDAPPTNSVNDIVNETYADSSASRYTSLRNSTFDASTSRNSLFRSSFPSTPKPAAPTAQSTAQPLYVVVFGYPPDKYSVTAEYFCSIGDTTEPEQNPEISNCFRVGYMNPAEAMRAVRKNGDIMGGTWMIGVKWADPAQAEALLGSSFVRGPVSSPELNGHSPDVVMSSSTSGGFGVFPSSSRMSVDEPGFGTHSRMPSTPTPTVGTPIRLAPSAAAFRKAGAGGSPQKAGQGVINTLPSGNIGQSPSKGMLEQVSDLIFGW